MTRVATITAQAATSGIDATLYRASSFPRRRVHGRMAVRRCLAFQTARSLDARLLAVKKHFPLRGCRARPAMRTKWRLTEPLREKMLALGRRRHRIVRRGLHGFGCVRHRGFRRRYLRFWNRLHRNFALRRLRCGRIGTGPGRLRVRLLRPGHGRLRLAGDGWRDLHPSSHSHGEARHSPTARSCRRTLASAASRGRTDPHPMCRSSR